MQGPSPSSAANHIMTIWYERWSRIVLCEIKKSGKIHLEMGQSKIYKI